MPIALAITALIGYLLFSSSVDTMSDVVKKVVPDTYDDLFKKYGAIYGVDWLWLKRISWVESNTGLNSRVAKGIKTPSDVEGSKSYDGLSWGLMQMTLTTAKDYDKNATAIKLNNPTYAIELSARHIKMLKTLFPNERDVIMSYNHGQGNQKKFLLAEKNGTLKTNEYVAGKDYWSKYNVAKGIV